MDVALVGLATVTVVAMVLFVHVERPLHKLSTAIAWATLTAYHFI